MSPSNTLKNSAMREDVQKSVCPECGSRNLVRDEEAGEVVCGRCGLVIEGLIMNTGPEWRAFTTEESEARARAGPSISFSKYDKGLSSVMWIGRDASGQKLSVQDRYRMMQLRKWNIRSRLRNTAERNLSQAMGELNRLCEKMNIPPNLHEAAALIYRKALKEDLVRGRSISALAAASLYLALRKAGVPRTLKEVCEASTRSRKEISRSYRLLLRELEYSTPIDDPVHHVSKIASKAGLSQRVQIKAITLLREGRQKQVTVGKDPSGMAAAALYIASVELSEKVTQKKLAESAGITEVTVRNRYKGLIRDMKLNVAKTLVD